MSWRGTLSKRQARFIEWLLRVLGIREGRRGVPEVFETLEPRTLMSIAALGPPVKVNSGGSLANTNAQIASAANGNFVVAWVGATGSFSFRLFDAAGNPLTGETITSNTVDTTASGATVSFSPVVIATRQQVLDVAMDSAGDFAVVWQGAHDIYAQQFASDGGTVGSVINVSNTGAGTLETAPAIAMDSAGDFAVTWLTDTTVNVNVKTMSPKTYYEYFDGINTNKVKRITTPLSTAINASTNPYVAGMVKARRFDANGSAGAVINVTPAAAAPVLGVQTMAFRTDLNPDVAMDSAGDFAVGFDSFTFSPKKILGQVASKSSYLYHGTDSNSKPVTVTLHSYTGSTFYYDMTLNGGKALAQRYSTAGSANGAALVATSRTASLAGDEITSADLKISMDSAGDFAVTSSFQYQKTKTTGTASTYYATAGAIVTRRFNSAGAAVGGETTVATAAFTPFFGNSPIGTESALLSDLATTMDPGGNLLITWDKGSFNVNSSAVDSTGIFGRRYNLAGAAQEAAPSQVTIGAGAGFFFPAVAYIGSNIALAYQASGNASTDVFVGLYRPVLPASKVVFSTQPVDGNAGPLTEIDVQLQDSGGFVVTDGTSKVTLSVLSGPVGGKLLGTVTVSSVSGVAAFTGLTLLRGGTYVLKATDGALTGATSSSFLISTPATQLAFATQPLTVVAGQTMSAFTVQVWDINGDLETGNSSTVTLSIATGGGTILGTLSHAAVNGVATFDDISLPVAGTYTLQAADGGLSNATSSKFIVTPGAAVSMAFSTQPVDATAGGKMTVKVTLRDALNNVATLDHTKVALSILSGPGGPIVGSVLATVTGGVATFANISFTRAGDYVLQAADGLVTSVSSNSFTISPGIAKKLVFDEQPGNTVAGVAVPTFEVDVEDAFGNVVASDNAAMTLTVVSKPPGAATIQGTLIHNSTTGVTLFNDIVLRTAGSYQLKAVQGNLSVTSQKFTISPDVVAKLVFITQPKPTVAGKAISPAVSVQVRDQFDNLLTANTSTVTMVIHSGPGSLSGTATASALKGVATFKNLILQTPGDYTLTATGGILTGATSNSFHVT